MKRSFASLIIVACALWLCSGVFAAESSRHKPRQKATKTVQSTTVIDVEPRARIVHYGPRDVVKLKTKVRITTIIVLPEKEQILDFTCGDRDYWVINGTQNLAYIKPAKEGAMTNLNLITSAGNIYTFVLTEVSELGGTEPDYKVFIEPKEESVISTSTQAPKFVPASELETYRKELEFAREENERIRKQAEEILDQELSRQMTHLHFPYRFQPEKAPFHVSSIYHDQKFTYIVAKPDELPSVYEIRDGKLNLINFEYKNGVFILGHVVDRGYLSIGKQRMAFISKESR